MKILSIANISNVDDLLCDSGLTFQRILASSFSGLGHSYVLAVPDNCFHAVRELLPKTTQIVSIPVGTTRYTARFSFVSDQVLRLVEETQPDVIFNNQFELTAALRSILVSSQNRETALVSYCHYPALWHEEGRDVTLDGSLDKNGLGIAILFDVLSALRTADAVIIQSEFAKKLVEGAAEFHRVGEYASFHVVPPPLDTELLEEPLGEVPQDDIILYNHRLYDSYGTPEFIELWKKLSNLGGSLLVLDPMPSRSVQRSRLSDSPSRHRSFLAEQKNVIYSDGNLPRSAYAAQLKRGRLGFAALRKSCVWSMACVDCLSLGIPVVAPNYAAYPEFIPSELLFDDHESAMAIASELIRDDSFWSRSSMASRQMVEACHPDVIAKKLLGIFESALRSLRGSEYI